MIEGYINFDQLWSQYDLSGL